MYKRLVASYVNHFDQENHLSELVERLADFSDKEWTNRRNMEGHFTASSFVVCKSDHRVLLLFHRLFQQYVQPGGHIDPSDRTPLEAARRELAEETGLKGDLLHYYPLLKQEPLVPFNIKCYRAPENKKKSEREHIHYDLQYLFLVDSMTKIEINQMESTDYRWIDWTDFRNLVDYREMASKIADLVGDEKDI